MPYKYVAEQETTSLSEAPRFILNALHRLTWAGEQTVKDGSFRKFNEVLTLGYFEKQAIGVSTDPFSINVACSQARWLIYGSTMTTEKRSWVLPLQLCL